MLENPPSTLVQAPAVWGMHICPAQNLDDVCAACTGAQLANGFQQRPNQPPTFIKLAYCTSQNARRPCHAEVALRLQVLNSCWSFKPTRLPLSSCLIIAGKVTQGLICIVPFALANGQVTQLQPTTMPG